MKIIILSLLLSTISWAQVDGDSSMVTPTTTAHTPLIETPTSISLGLETTSFKYSETNMKQTGAMNGFNAVGHYRFNPDYAINSRIDYTTGKLDYDGQYQNGAQAKSEDKYAVLDLGINAEFLTDISVENKTSFLLGLGRRQTNDANDSSPSDYAREHVYNYFSVAIQLAIPHSKDAVTTMYFGIDSMFSGYVKTQLSDVDPSLPNLDQKFTGGTATNFGVKHTRRYNLATVYVGLSYKAWDLKESESTEVTIDGERWRFFEPKNSTTVVALDAGFLF